MIKLSCTGVGTDDVSADKPIDDSTGTGKLPIQAKVTGTATFRIMGKVAQEAPWMEVRPADTAGFLESINWLPFLRLDITAGDGSVDLWVGEK